MGQKVNPVGMRIGINRDWSSRWYANKKEFAKYLKQDMLIRNHIEPKLADAMLSHVDIERIKGKSGKDIVTINIHVARPGVVIGQNGENIKVLKAGLVALIDAEDVKLNIVEIKNPDLDATLVAQSIAKQLEERASFRTVQKKAIQRVMKAGAKGCKTQVKGRVGGAEIARSEQYREGVLSLHTLSQDIDYALAEAHTTYGRIGCKVWISRPDAATMKEFASREHSDRRFDRRNRAPREEKKGA